MFTSIVVQKSCSLFDIKFYIRGVFLSENIMLKVMQPNPKLKECEHCHQLKAINAATCVHCGGRDQKVAINRGLWFYFGVIIPICLILWFGNFEFMK